MKNIIFFALLIPLLFTSCTSIIEPTIERIEDVDVLEMSKSNLELNAFMILNNPNGFALDLAKANLIAYVDEIELATINQTFETSMPANDDFRMPISIKLDLDKLYNENPLEAIAKGLQLMAKRKIKVHFKGTILVGKGIAKVSVPVDQEEEISF